MGAVLFEGAVLIEEAVLFFNPHLKGSTNRGGRTIWGNAVTKIFRKMDGY